MNEIKSALSGKEESDIKASKDNYKICRVCQQSKLYSEFKKRKTAKDGLFQKCKDCFIPRGTVAKEGYKFCSQCNSEKPRTEFFKDAKRKDRLCTECKDCQFPNRIIKPILSAGFRRCTKCRQDKIEREHFCLEFIKRDQKHRYRAVCRVCDNERRRINKQANPEREKAACKKWRENNKERHNNNCNINFKKKMKEDPIFKMRRQAANSIRKAIKRSGSTKKCSTWSKLPYTPEELKNHIESLWESWMSWENHGQYKKDIKTWHIDHIIPQVDLPYDSMDHPNFLKSWNLSNLRPLESVKNMTMGGRLSWSSRKKIDSIKKPLSQ